MKRVVVAFGWGALFGLGLFVSGMTQPPKVLAFLDVTGHWDPSLAFVMAGALLVFALLRPMVLRLRGTADVTHAAVEPPSHIDLRVILGAALFGVGWGLAGYCPGPVIVAAGGGSGHAIIVAGAMLLGIRLADVVMDRVDTTKASRTANDMCT